jgi:hypothetical protein
MNFAEYSRWMSIAAVVILIGVVIVSRVLRNVAITKPNLQKGAMIVAAAFLTIFLVWGVLYEVLR